MRFALLLGLGAGLLLAACQDDSEDKKSDPPTTVVAVADAPIDRSSRAGRVFMYLDNDGSVVRTANYEEIPVAKRSAVMVVEGRTRSRVRPKKGGGIQIEALPPLVAPGSPKPSDADDGAAGAKAILADHPPEGKGPPSTDKWTDEQWRGEIKRELEELRKEQAQAP